MRDAINIKIEEIIIHILDPEGQGLILSNVKLPLNGNRALREYFTRHITDTFKAPGIKAARFRNINPEQPSGICRALLRKELSLVEGSQSLAQALYMILQRDHRITAGDLAVCLFQAENYPYTNFLAIMKVDPSQIFRHVVLTDEQGNRYVSFEAESKAFTNERLQKCAFIQPLEPRHPDYDMLLLDRQVGGAEYAEIARFFSESFLDAEDAYDPHKFTDSLYRNLVQAENLVRDRLTPSEDQKLESHINSALTGRKVNLDRWLEELPLAEDVKKDIDHSISSTIAVREFNIDRELSKRLVRKTKYRGDYNFKLEIPSENYHQVIVSEEYISDDPKRPPYYRIVIETENWQRLA